MIKQVTLKCFRRHTDLKVDFSSGLNVVRGANEAGKSTVLEAVLYALYGAKALRNPLADTVTWGHKESELKVELVIVVAGVEYTFTRSKAGAEVNWPGGKVVGQAEVTGHAVTLLGADAKTAAMLMLSSQSGLRGALDEGPTAVSSLMGRLADFDLIDRLLEVAQTELLLGSEAPIKAKLDDAVAGLQKLQDEAPSDARWKALDQDIEGFQKSLADAIRRLEEASPAFAQAEKAYMVAIEHNNGVEANETRLQSLIEQHSKVAADLAAAQGAARHVPPEDLKAAEAEYQTALNHKNVVQAYKLVLSLGEYPEVFWDEPRAAFDEALADLRKQETELIRQMQEANGEATRVRRGLIKGGKCPTCGHKAVSDEHVQEHNAKIEEEARGYEKSAAAVQTKKNEVAREISLMSNIRRMADEYDVVRRQVEGKGYTVEIADDVVPPRITWTGPKPGVADVEGKKVALQRLQDAERAAVQAEGRVQVHSTKLKEIQIEIKACEVQAEKVKRMEVDALIDEYNRWATAKTHAQAQITDITVQRDNIKRERDLEWARWQDAQRNIDALKGRIEEYSADLKKLAFNNNLIKKLRSLKPMITDSLWATILAAVSNFFSSLRGEQSVVTKDMTGFRVNGQSASSLSGSTLDILAKSVRVALVKTFVPHCDFMVLDEPFAAMDEERTAKSLGFLAACGFSQVILASHEDASTSVASHIVDV